VTLDLTELMMLSSFPDKVILDVELCRVLFVMSGQSGRCLFVPQSLKQVNSFVINDNIPLMSSPLF